MKAEEGARMEEQGMANLLLIPSNSRASPWPSFSCSWNSLKQDRGLARSSRKPWRQNHWGQRSALPMRLPRRRAWWKRVQGLGPRLAPPPWPLLLGRESDRVGHTSSVLPGRVQSPELGWGTQGQPPTLHLLVRRNEAQELVHVAHKQPVGVEFHGGLHLLGGEEVLQRLVHLLAVGAAHTGLNACYGRGRGRGATQRSLTGLEARPRRQSAPPGKGTRSLGCLYSIS